LFPQKFLSVQFLFLLDFAAYKKTNKIFFISFSYCLKYIGRIKKEGKSKMKKKSRKKKTFIGFCCRKLNKGKLDQINLEFAKS
jgi:hypothetical protein